MASLSGSDAVTTSTLELIEAAIDQLTLPEQIHLMERLADRIRTHTLGAPNVNEPDLMAMANDPAIQREIQQIEAEFATVEADGLDRG